MKNFATLLFLCFCGLCYSQEAQQIDSREELPYDKATLDNTLKQFLSIDDSQLTFYVYQEMEDNFYVDVKVTFLKLQQYCGDYRILDGNLVVYTKEDKITRISGTYYPSVEIMETTPLMPESEILKIVEKEVFASKTDYDFQYEIEKVISKNYLDNNDKNLYYASKVIVSDGNDLGTRIEVIIDEGTGRVLRKNSLTICEFCYLSTLSFQKSNSYISPNPVKDYLTLTLPTDNKEIKIFDLQGKLMLQQNVGFSAEINVLSLKTGTYVLVVNGESYKFVKE